MAKNVKKTDKTKKNAGWVSALMKKYPNLSSRILYFTMMAGVIAGGAKVYNSLDSSNDTDNSATPVVTEVVMDVPPVEKPATFGEFLEKMRPLEPLMIADLINKEGVNLNKAGLHAPYYDKIGKCWTIGFGSTILQNGKRVTAHTKPLTTEQAYELARWHLENETLFAMFCYEAGVDSVHIDTDQEALVIESIIYNTGIKMIETPSNKSFKNVNLNRRTGLLYQDLKEYGNDLPASLVRQRFQEYPVTHTESVGEAWLGGKGADVVANKIGNFLKGGGGIVWRRWLEAGILTGEVKPELLMECPLGAIPAFVITVGKDRKNWFTGDAPDRKLNKKAFAQFREWIKNPVDNYGYSLAHMPKVKDYLPDYARQMCESGMCQIGNKEFIAKFDMSGHDLPRVKDQIAKTEQYANASRKVKSAGKSVAVATHTILPGGHVLD